MFRKLLCKNDYYKSPPTREHVSFFTFNLLCICLSMCTCDSAHVSVYVRVCLCMSV